MTKLSVIFKIVLICFFTSWICVPAHATERQDLSVLKQAPDFSLPNINTRQPTKLSDYLGKVILIDFWASWCGPCRASLPEYDALRTRLRQTHVGERFEILAINVDVTTEDALAFLKDYPVNFPVLEERSGRTQQAFDLLVMPTSLLIDQEGNIRVAHQGFNKAYIHYLEEEILKLIPNPSNKQ